MSMTMNRRTSSRNWSLSALCNARISELSSDSSSIRHAVGKMEKPLTESTEPISDRSKSHFTDYRLGLRVMLYASMGRMRYCPFIAGRVTRC